MAPFLSVRGWGAGQGTQSAKMSALAFSMPSIVRNITIYYKKYYINIVQFHMKSGKISDK